MHDMAHEILRRTQELVRGMSLSVHVKCFCGHDEIADWVVLHRDDAGRTVVQRGAAQFVISDAAIVAKELANELKLIITRDDDQDDGVSHAWYLELASSVLGDRSTIYRTHLSNRAHAKLAQALLGMINMYGMLRNIVGA